MADTTPMINAKEKVWAARDVHGHTTYWWSREVMLDHFKAEATRSIARDTSFSLVSYPKARGHYVLRRHHPGIDHGFDVINFYQIRLDKLIDLRVG